MCIRDSSIGYEIKILNPNLEIYTPNNHQELINLIQEKTKPKAKADATPKAEKK